MTNYNIHIDPLFSMPVMIPEERYSMSKETKLYIERCLRELNGPEDNSNEISVNKYVLNEPELKDLNDWIMNYIRFYASNIMKFKNCDFYITQSWINYTKKTQKHHVHYHPNSLISGVFYLNDDDAKINFYRGDDQFALSFVIDDFNVFNSGKYQYNTKENGLILFPSKTRHDVDIQKSDKVRISIAFNTWATGSFGELKHANKLELR